MDIIPSPKCGSCKSSWIPDKDDIKSSGLICKTCKRCREYSEKYRQKKTQNKIVNDVENKINNDYTLDNKTIICNKCKVKYTPCDSDISIKNPNKYYKGCEACRNYFNNARKKHFDAYIPV